MSPETEVIDFWHACEHLQTASDHAVAPGWFEKYREILRHDPRGVAKVIRALATFAMPPLRRTGPRPSGNSPSSASIAIACATTP